MLRIEKMSVREETIGTQTLFPSQSDMVMQENFFEGSSITPFNNIHNWKHKLPRLQSCHAERFLGFC